MQCIIHRGTQEIGGTCVEVRAGDTRILIDFGMPLVDSHQAPFDSKILTGKSIEELKKLKILPEIKGLYKGEERAIDAILISHSHMDHYGLLQYAHSEIPVYLTDGAKKLIEISDIFIPNKVGTINSRVIAKHQKSIVGDFTVTPYLVDHSAFDALAYLIEADGKRLFYSGDFRAHGRKGKLFDRMLSDPPKPIDCLLMEGSMMGRGAQLYQDEAAVEEGMVEILRQKKNVAFLFASSQNIDRIVSAYRACLRTDSIFVIDIYTAFILHQLGDITKHIPQFDWKNIRVRFFYNHAESLVQAGYKELLYIFNQKKIEPAEIADKREKILMLLRHNSLFPKEVKRIGDIKGAAIIYSMWEGYLKDEFVVYCQEHGIGIKQVHTSGHATVEDLRAFADALSPKVLIPIHTFEAGRFSELFNNVQVLQDGEGFDLD